MESVWNRVCGSWSLRCSTHYKRFALVFLDPGLEMQCEIESGKKESPVCNLATVSRSVKLPAVLESINVARV